MKRVIIGVAGLIISSLCIWSSILICEDYEEPQEVIFIGVPIYEKKKRK